MIERFFNWFQQLLPTIIAAITILIAGFIMSKITIKLMSKGLKKGKIDPTIHSFLLSLVKTILHIFIIIIVLSVLHVPMSSIVAAVGAAGLAIGLALQNSLSNIAGGFIILFSKPFKKGDFVQIDDESGSVDSISILYTKLLTPDNKAIHIPNGHITSSVITNYNEEDIRRLDLTFAIGYHNDYKKAISIIENIISNHNNILSHPSFPLVRVGSLENSNISISVKVWVNSGDYWSLNYDIIEEVKDAFDANGIDKASQIVDVNIVEK